MIILVREQKNLIFTFFSLEHFHAIMYPFSGMQSGVLVGAHRTGLPLEFKLMPEYLNGRGYKSVAVGKWHLGSSRAAYTPTRSRPRMSVVSVHCQKLFFVLTRRGFASHVGYWTGHEDYYDHTAEEIYGYPNTSQYVVRSFDIPPI